MEPASQPDAATQHSSSPTGGAPTASARDESQFNPTVQLPTNEPGSGADAKTVQASPEEILAATKREEERPLPKTFGRYQVRGEIARGGMGAVFRAYDPKLDREVALKVMLADEMWASETMVDRFQREAKAAARLHHSNIVPIYDFGRAEGKHYFTMELIDGESLSHRIHRLGPLPPREAASMLATIARAVHYAHTEGVIHRDIKPQNILLSAGRPPLLTDFGLAKETRSGSDLTRSGAVLGTPAYMAPEQAEGRTGEIDERTDVYSLGAVLYEMLTGRPPFIAEDAVDIVQQVRKEEPPSIRRLMPSIAADLVTVTTKAMDKAPVRRYTSARHLAEDLDRFLAGDAILARPLSRAEWLLRRAKRNRAVVVPLCAGLALAAGFGVWGVVNAHRRAASEAQRQEAQAQRDDVAAKRQSEEEAGKLLESARMALDGATLCLYRKDADYASLVERLKKAQTVIEQAIAQAPRLPLGYYLLGRAGDLQGLHDAAEESWRKAISLDPRFGPPHYQLGLWLMARAYMDRLHAAGVAAEGKHTEWERASSEANLGEASRLKTEAERSAAAARIELEMATQAAGGLETAIEAEIAHAMLAFVQDDRSAVRRVCSAALDRFKGEAGLEQFHLLEAAVSESRNERMRELDAAIEIRPQFPLALMDRASQRLESSDYSGAIDDFSRALLTDPYLPELWELRGVARGATGDWKGAIADDDEGLKLMPQSAVLHNNRGGARRQMGDVDGAIEDCQEALKLDPTLLVARVNLGIARAMKGDLDGALGELDHVLERDPRYVRALDTRGCVRRDKGDASGARADYDQALQIDPCATGVLVNRSALRLSQGDIKGAMGDLGQALSVDPRCYEALVKRGCARRDQGDLDGAMSDLDAAVKVRPRAVDALIERALAKKQKGASVSAIADLDEVLRTDPTNRRARYDRGGFRWERGDLEGALEDSNEVLRLHPQDADALCLRGTVLRDKNDRQGALRDLDECLRLDPNNLTALIHRGGTRDSLGDVRGLVEDYTRALQLAPPDWPYRKQVEANLQSARDELAKPR